MEFVKVDLLKRNHKVGMNYWHLEFATKYRYKMFGKFEYKSLIEASIRKVAKTHSIKIEIIRVMPEHVHLLVTLPMLMSDSEAFRVLKGASAYYFFKHHPKARLRYPRGHLWSRGGCVITVGYNQFSDTVKYILNQEQNHALI
jgi:putative transposase